MRESSKLASLRRNRKMNEPWVIENLGGEIATNDYGLQLRPTRQKELLLRQKEPAQK